MLIEMPSGTFLKAGKETAIDQKYLQSFTEGFTYIFHSPKLLGLCFLCILINSAVVPFDALLAPVAAEMFAGDAQIVSLLSVSVTIGTIVGAMRFANMDEKKKKDMLVVICGIVLGGYYLFLVMISVRVENLWAQRLLLCGSSVLVGVSLGIMSTYVQVKFVKEVEPQFIGRVTTIRFSMTYACAPVVSFLISAVSKILDISSIFIASGIIIVILFLLVGCRCLKGRHYSQRSCEQ